MEGPLGGDVVEGPGLCGGARETIEDVAARDRVVLLEPLVDDADHDLVADETAGVDDLLGHSTELRPLPHRGAQHVAGGDVGNHEVA